MLADKRPAPTASKVSVSNKRKKYFQSVKPSHVVHSALPATATFALWILAPAEPKGRPSNRVQGFPHQLLWREGSSCKPGGNLIAFPGDSLPRAYSGPEKLDISREHSKWHHGCSNGLLVCCKLGLCFERFMKHLQAESHAALMQAQQVCPRWPGKPITTCGTQIQIFGPDWSMRLEPASFCLCHQT